MPPTTVDEVIAQALGLVSRSFNSVFNMFGTLFTAIILFSPLPDEVDFLLVCLALIWLVSFLIRMVRGKNL